MTTASQIIAPALEHAGVKDPRQDADPYDAATAIMVLNDMMLALADHEGIELGYTIVSASADAITVPDWAHGMMRAQLALRLCDRFGRTPTAALAAEAQIYLAGVRRRCVRIRRSPLPDGLPTGQGNAAYSDCNFFRDSGADDLRDGLGNALTDENGRAVEAGPCDL